MPQSRDDTSIRVKDVTADRLHKLKERGDTYDDVIWQLIEAVED